MDSETKAVEVPKPKCLLAKLAEIVAEIDHVEKSGRNEFQKYNYVKAADVAHAVRKHLSERNIYLVVDVVETRPYEIPAKEGVMQAVDIKTQFSFFDGDMPSAPPIVFHACGTGTDKGDKAIYKAMTGALKYGLRHAFLIPDESDPEADTSVDKALAKKVSDEVEAQKKNKGVPSAPKAQEMPSEGPAQLVCYPIGDGWFEVTGESEVMEAHKGLLLLYGKRKGKERIVQMEAGQLDSFKHEFCEVRGNLLTALKGR